MEKHEIDVCIGQRIFLDRASEFWQIICQMPNVKTVYEIDDNLFVTPRWNPAYPLFANPEVRSRILANIMAADLVTVSTVSLGEFVAQHNPNVVVLENCIDAALLTHERPRRDRLTVGWAGSPTHEQDLLVAAHAIGDVLLAKPSVDLHLIGTDYSGMFPRILQPKIRTTPWNPETDKYFDNIDFDIGLAPLCDDRFNHYKSHIKALEYAALGVPVIASPETPYRDFIVHGKTGFFARTEDEWRKYLLKLIRDDRLRERMGTNAKALANQYAIQNRWRQWEHAYQNLLNTR
jgi:glycosyltransferase involved in cell wall biosynthesis